ncbi:MAG: putative hydrophobic protein (TIGR00271 family) [Flavobacteriaceae bacterium]|jgi:uncharacterized hydrophobic protein (TIGR00271 family)
MKTLFHSVTKEDKKTAIEKLVSDSTPSSDFFAMMICSVLIATLGLLTDSVAIVIGSMLIAPLLYPVLSIGMGIVMADHALIVRSVKTLLKASVFAIVAGALLTLLFSNFYLGVTGELQARTLASLPSIAIAIIAGFAASLAFVKPKLNEMLPGVAIAIALVPPLATIGVGLARLNFSLVTGALLLFVVNVVGIVLASMVVFSLMNFYPEKKETDKIIKEADAENLKE